MKMSSEQQTKFEAWLRSKCSYLKCALCQSVRWKIGDLLLPVQIGEPDTMAPLMAQLVCKNCAHVVLFDVRRVTGATEEAMADPSQTMIF